MGGPDSGSLEAPVPPPTHLACYPAADGAVAQGWLPKGTDSQARAQKV